MASDGIPDKRKLIVNYLPQSMTDQEFTELFSACGKTTNAKVMRDKASGYSFGYGFVEYSSEDESAMAIAKLNGWKVGGKVLKVAYSKPAGASKNVNLYLTGLGPQTTEERLHELFSPYGNVIQVKILKDKGSSTSKETGFVLFGRKEEADQAIKSLQGYADGYGMNLQIKYAKDPVEQQKTHPMYQQYLQSVYTHGQYSGATPYGGVAGQPQSQQYGAWGQMGVYSAMPGTGVQGMYGQQVGSSGYEQQVGSLGSGYGGGYNNGALGAQKAGRGRGVAQRFNPMARPGQIAGVPGAIGQGPGEQGSYILFAYNIGKEAQEKDLYGLFAQFGRIAKVNVIHGKGYGFVHMPLYHEAAEAVSRLNGLYYNGRNLQVSFKSERTGTE